MKKALLMSVVVLAPVGAFAADLPARTAPAAPSAPIFVQVDRWSGFYAGVGVGWHTSGARSRVSYAVPGAGETGFDAGNVYRGPGFFTALNEYAGLAGDCGGCLVAAPNGYLANPDVAWPTGLGRSSDGLAGTLAAGWNWQRGAFVFGVEADVSFLRNRERSEWSGFGSGAFAVFTPAFIPDPEDPRGPIEVNGLGNYNRYVEQGYACEPTFPPPPNNRWTCTPPGGENGGGARPATITQGDYTVETRMSVRARTDWVSTARLRAGFTTGPLFIYATGGLAFGDTRLSVNAEAIERLNIRTTEGAPPVLSIAQAPGVTTTAAQRTVTTWTANRNRTEVGFALGAGAEWALSDNWSLKGEYVYYNLGSRSLRVNGVSTTTGTGLNAAVVQDAAPITARHKFDGHIVRVGLNYRFGGPAAAVMAPVVAAY